MSDKEDIIKIKNKRKLINLFLLILLFLFLLAIFFILNQKFHFFADVKPIKIYVAPNGNDSWSGLVSDPSADNNDGPLATIEKARDKIREIKNNGGLSSPINVEIKGGVYELSETLVFTDKDVGTKEFPITYEGFGSKTVISGSKNLNLSWNKCSNSDPKCEGLSQSVIDKVYYASAGDRVFNSLFVDNNKVTRARIPNEGEDTGNKDASGKTIGAGFYNLANCQNHKNDVFFSDNFEFRPGDIKSTWRNLEQINVSVFAKWKNHRFSIKSIDGNKVFLRADGLPTNNKSVQSLYVDSCQTMPELPGSRYYLDNVFEAIDLPTEWYLDTSNSDHILYYLPKPNEQINSLVFRAPLVKKLINIGVESENSDSSDSKVSYNLIFKNLFFEQTDWSLPPGGYYDVQSLAPALPKYQKTYLPDYPSPPAVFIGNAQDLVFKNNSFNNLGGHGILARFTDNLIIENNEFADLGSSGIVFGDNIRSLKKDTDDYYVKTSNIKIENNSIHDFGQTYNSAVGILCMLAEKIFISKNDLYNGNYTGIQIGWEWEGQLTGARDNKIENNHIYNVGQMLTDGGGIYVVGWQPGSKISNNLVHGNLTTPAHLKESIFIGVYLDSNTKDYTVNNNILFNNNYNFNFNQVDYNEIQNNILVDAKIKQVSFNKPRNISYSKNISAQIYNPSDVPFIAGAIINPIPDPKNNDNLLNAANTYDSNLYYNREEEYLPVNLFARSNLETNWHNITNWIGFKEFFNYDQKSLAVDPEFNNLLAFDSNDSSDFLKRDYSLKTSSPAFSLGFQQIDTSEIGSEEIVGPIYLSEFPNENIFPLFSSINLENDQIITVNPYVIDLKVGDTNLVSKVEFFADDSLICSVSLPDVEKTYSCHWDTSGRQSAIIKAIIYPIESNAGGQEKETIVRNVLVKLSQNYQNPANNDQIPIIDILPQTGYNQNN